MAASKAKKHSNDAQNKSNSGKANKRSTEDKASQDKSKDHHNGKKGAAILVPEQQVWRRRSK